MASFSLAHPKYVHLIQPYNLSQSMFLPPLHLWPHGQANPDPTDKLLKALSRSSSWDVLLTHSNALQLLLGKRYTREGQRESGIFLYPLIALSALPAPQSSTLCSWTAHLISDNLGVFSLFLYSIIQSYYLQLKCNYNCCSSTVTTYRSSAK